MSAYFGLDLGSSSLKVVQADLLGSKKFNLRAVGIAQNMAGSLDVADPAVVAKLAPVVKQLLVESGIKEKRAVVSVPESKVFSRIISMPNMSDVELNSAVMWEAEQFVPIPVAEVEIDYVVVKRPDKDSSQKEMLVYLVASPKKYLQAIVDFMLALGVEPIAIESEMAAVARALTFGSEDVSASLLVHIGALSTVMAIVEAELVQFSHYMNSGGVALTRAITQALKLPIAQAEEYKRTYGLDEKQLEGKVRQSLLVVMESVVAEIRKAIEFYATENQARVNRIVLSGGGAYLPDLVTYLGGVFGGMEVMVGDPFVTATATRGVEIPQERAAYSVAVGLAVRSF